MDLFCKFTPVPPWIMKNVHKFMRNEAPCSKSEIMRTWGGGKRTVYSAQADTVSFSPVQKDPKGKTKLSLVLMYNRETTSLWFDCLLIARWLLAADFMQNVESKVGGGSMERTGPGGRGGVDFISLHHWADTVLTQAGRVKAQGKAVISQCMCACKNICVSLLSHPW